MTPKEKAEKLVDKFRIVSYGKYSIPTKNKAKQCALIAVDLALEYNDYDIEFLQEVKHEIINL
jgi:hypothetical protein